MNMVDFFRNFLDSSDFHRIWPSVTKMLQFRRKLNVPKLNHSNRVVRIDRTIFKVWFVFIEVISKMLSILLIQTSNKVFICLSFSFDRTRSYSISANQSNFLNFESISSKCNLMLNRAENLKSYIPLNSKLVLNMIQVTFFWVKKV